ncbi:FPGS [Cordylochernes scorpioides]|uniref:Folylpolyglutamate synthase n=1 Tax=Cordylochernes scorpioides TaxID=51811 RepID=A0ABY6LQB6_9ARAC|nr:FPGS [Cordylochernes scorpioides]
MYKNTNAQMVPQTSSYEEAIFALNGLQSNAAVIAKMREEKKKDGQKALDRVRCQVGLLGITQEDLESLKVIHVAGTKGKGSTCAFTESILRAHGYTTGFFSSPHLVVVRERIRINGKPISKEKFTHYFWKVYNKLKSNEDISPMPGYFVFLNLMSLYTFLHEKVDATILEVGIGGQYDSTNIVDKPVVTGISSLGIDHTAILGYTIKEIAWHKAGIFKQNVPAFTVTQPEGAMSILQNRAYEINCPLYLTLPLETYEWENNCNGLGVDGSVQSINASLAIHLARTWLNKQTGNNNLNTSFKYNSEYIILNKIPPPHAPLFTITNKYAQGLANCQWPGRCQTIERGQILYCLDGAHTEESIINCADWFTTTAAAYPDRARVLLFNCTGDRPADILLAHLLNLKFTTALFSPNYIAQTLLPTSDQTNYTTEMDRELSISTSNLHIWNHYVSQGEIPCQTHSFPCLQAAHDFIATLPPSVVLVTGSIRLVGALLSIMYPDSST